MAERLPLERVAAAAHLPELIALLLAERSAGSGCANEKPGDAVAAGVQAQWDLFRALVNTRPAAPASERFLALQDALLRGIIATRGVTDAGALPPCGADERLSLWRGDITTLAADAVVNAANSQMLGCWVPGHFCIDNAIHTFAGVQLRLECARLMEAQGFPEPTGMAKVTGAWNLPSRHVVHTVGPIAEGAPTALDRRLLANCYEACLDAAADATCETIAFCSISTGVFGFPAEEACPIAVETVRRWLDAHPASPVRRVVFNVFSERDEKLYRRQLA